MNRIILETTKVYVNSVTWYFIGLKVQRTTIGGKYRYIECSSCWDNGNGCSSGGEFTRNSYSSTDKRLPFKIEVEQGNISWLDQTRDVIRIPTFLHKEIARRIFTARLEHQSDEIRINQGICDKPCRITFRRVSQRKSKDLRCIRLT